MRSTLKMAANTSINNINNSYYRLSKVMNQMGRHQRVVNLSDDPLSANIGMRMDTMTARTTQFNRSIAIGGSFLTLTDGVLGEAKTLLDKAKSLTIGAATETTTAEMRRSMAIEAASALQEILALANSFDGSRYLFGGSQTTSAPFEMVAGRYVRYTGNSNPFQIEVDANTFHTVNTTGDAAFGRLAGIVKSRAYNPALSLATGKSTPLADCNEGVGVPSGSIRVHYSSYPEGVEIDISHCDTLEDVVDYVARETKRLSAAVGPEDPNYDPDFADRYLEISLNADHSGLSVREIDAGDRQVDHLGRPFAGSRAGPTGAAIQVGNVGMSSVASALGIAGGSKTNGVITGADITPRLSAATLLADLDGYLDQTFSITNGALPGEVRIQEDTLDSNNVFNNWRLEGLAKNVNTGPGGELYAKAVRLAGSSLTPGNDVFKSASLNDSFYGAADAPAGELYVRCIRAGTNNTRVEVYADPARTQLVAVGIDDGAGRVGALNRVDETGGVAEPPVSIGSMEINRNLAGTKDGDFSDFALAVDANDNNAVRNLPTMDNWGLIGLNQENTGSAGTLYTESIRNADGTVTVNVYTDETMNLKVASGTASDKGDGTAAVQLTQINGSGLSGGVTVDLTGLAGEGARATQTLTAGLEEPDLIRLEIYRKPVNRALEGDLVASATSSSNGTFVLQEANNSGLSGTVGLNLQPDAATREISSSVNLTAHFDPTFRASVSVPAFREPLPGQPGADAAGLAAGWDLRGLERAAAGYIPTRGVDIVDYYNDHATTDPDGNLDVTIRRAPDGKGYEVLLARPEFGYSYSEGYPPVRRTVTVPSATIASGYLADPANQGRVEIRGLPGFEQVTGSVALELPATFAYDPESGPLDAPVTLAGGVRLGGLDNLDDGEPYQIGEGLSLAMPRDTVLPIGTVLGAGSILPAGTVLPAGAVLPSGVVADGQTPLNEAVALTGDMVLTAEVRLPDTATLAAGSALPPWRRVGEAGAQLEAGAVLHSGTTLAAGSILGAGISLPAGETLPPGTIIPRHNTLPAGTVLGPDTLLSAGTQLPDGRQLLADTRVGDLSPALPDNRLVLDKPWTLSGDITLGQDAALGGDFTSATDIVLGGDMALVAGSLVLQAPVDAAPGTALPYELPAGARFPAGSMPPAGAVCHTGDVPVRLGLQATFATVEDLMNAVNNNTELYAHMQIAADGHSLEVVSELAGAWLQVAETLDSVEQMGDTRGQLSHLNLAGLLQGQNTDRKYGLYSEVAHYPEDVELIHLDGTKETIKAGYYVRFYNDGVQPGLDYLDRDPGALMAQAYVPPEEYRAGAPLIIEPVNESGLSGSLRLDYVADDNTISVYPGGLRNQGVDGAVVSQVDLHGIRPGENASFDGEFYSEIVRDGNGAVTVRLYLDASRTHLVAEGVADENGLVALAERNGSRLSGSLLVASDLTGPTPGEVSTQDFVLSTGGLRQTGRVREQNVFSTFNDVIDAMYDQDTEALHNLIGDWSADIERLLDARADAGARSQRLSLLLERHERELVDFEGIKADRVGLDYSEAIVRYQMEQNIFDAALKVTGQFMPMSLIDYLR